MRTTLDSARVACRQFIAAGDEDFPDICTSFERDAREILDRPVLGFEDIVARALIAHAMADKDDAGNLLPSPHIAEQANLDLIEAVLALSRRMGLND